MPTHRAFMEGADSVWLLSAFKGKHEAILAESHLLAKVKGCSFSLMTDEQVKLLPTQEEQAIEILSQYGRLVDFPLISMNKKKRIAKNGSFITEACNLIDGMQAAFFDENQNIGGKRGRRQKFQWTPITITYRPYSGEVYSITIQPMIDKSGKPLPLYFAGDDILVHNSGADADALPNMISSMLAKVFPLSKTFRCPVAVVAEAQHYVPDIEAAEWAKPGSV